ncbi:hypothetical protein ACIBAB_00460 [Streptomyces rubiginosohelvolus]
MIRSVDKDVTEEERDSYIETQPTTDGLVVGDSKDRTLFGPEQW